MFDILKETKVISDMLQSSSINYAAAADLTESLADEVKKYRSDSEAQKYFETALSVAKKNNVNSNIYRRESKIPSSYESFIVLPSLGKFETIATAADLTLEGPGFWTTYKGQEPSIDARMFKNL